eukprot:m.46554 g.46554  ORF g.46554 m.46554 type:complete len:70 (+) comp10726_c0_seq2:86-295(+)
MWSCNSSPLLCYLLVGQGEVTVVERRIASVDAKTREKLWERSKFTFNIDQQDGEEDGKVKDGKEDNSCQ